MTFLYRVSASYCIEEQDRTGQDRTGDFVLQDELVNFPFAEKHSK